MKLLLLLLLAATVAGGAVSYGNAHSWIDVGALTFACWVVAIVIWFPIQVVRVVRRLL